MSMTRTEGGEIVMVTSRLAASPDCEEPLRRLLEDVRDRSRAHPDCLSFDLLQDTRETRRFVSIERWFSFDGGMPSVLMETDTTPVNALRDDPIEGWTLWDLA